MNVRLFGSLPLEKTIILVFSTLTLSYQNLQYSEKTSSCFWRSSLVSDIITVSSAYSITKSFRYTFNWFSISSDNVVNPLTSFDSYGLVVVVIYDHDHNGPLWWLDLQLPMQSVPITTNVVSSNPAHGEVYSIQQYKIKFVSDLRQVGCFFLVLRLKLKYCWKWRETSLTLAH